MESKYSQNWHRCYCNYCKFISPSDNGNNDGYISRDFRCFCREQHAYVPITSEACSDFKFYPLRNAYGFDETETLEDFKRAIRARRNLRSDIYYGHWEIYQAEKSLIL